VALDSDGTVFDSMRPKHEECFAPAFAQYFAPAEAEAARAVWRFVNLESRNRGVNRYRALVMCLRLLSGYPGLSRVDHAWAQTAAVLEAWLAREPTPTKANLALAAGDARLAAVLAWSESVDRAIASLPAPPAFAGAVAALPILASCTDILVLTGAPTSAIRSEWKRAGILDYAFDVAGQEEGPKASCLAARSGGRSASGSVLVVGDAPGDLEAARCTSSAFFPIIPGREEACWSLFVSTGLPRFLEGERSPGRGLIAEFLAALPADPPWLAGRTSSVADGT
jgi:phosphoglycolate phosphatase-like HAD superfamily hydrolase